MSFSVQVRPLGSLDPKRQIRGMLKDFKRATEKAEILAVNEAGRWATSQIGRRTAKEAQVPVRAVRKRLKTRKAFRNRRFFSISFIDTPVGFSELRYRQTRSGVRAGKHTQHGAFVAVPRRSRSGREEVFVRRGRTRFPIERVEVPLVPHSRRIARRILRGEARKRYEREFRRQFKRFTQKHRSR